MQHFNTSLSFRAYYGTNAAIAAFLNLAIAESNQGYANSQIPLTMSIYCVLDSSVQSENSYGNMINNFAASGSFRKSFI